MSGTTGPKGKRGDQGATGEVGPQGKKGSTGKSGLCPLHVLVNKSSNICVLMLFTYNAKLNNVSCLFQLLFAGDKGKVGDQGRVVGDIGLQGETGSIGKQGNTGPTGILFSTILNYFK